MTMRPLETSKNMELWLLMAGLSQMWREMMCN